MTLFFLVLEETIATSSNEKEDMNYINLHTFMLLWNTSEMHIWHWANAKYWGRSNKEQSMNCIHYITIDMLWFATFTSLMQYLKQLVTHDSKNPFLGILTLEGSVTLYFNKPLLGILTLEGCFTLYYRIQNNGSTCVKLYWKSLI